MKGNFKEIIKSDVPVIVDWYAEWCGPCKAMGPILEQLKAELGDSVKIIKVDTDDNPELAIEYQIRSIPTIMIFKNGENLYRESGIKTKEALISLVQKHSN
jgi:thioredoxin 1